jgi:ABC-type dipeptide/oligopeptide/nickel transport system permease subunit
VTKTFASFLLLILISLSLFLAIHPRVSGSVQDRDRINAGSTPEHVVGTDSLGRDRLARTAEGLLLCLTLSTAAALLATLLATVVALTIAYTPGTVSASILLLSDSLMALPGIFLLMMMRASLPLGMSAPLVAGVTFFLLAVLGWPMMVRTLLAEIRGYRQADWYLYCVASGLSRRSIFSSHVLAHLRPLLRTHLLICIPAFLIGESNLGALGLGVPEPLPSLGGMIYEMANSSLVLASNWKYLSPIVLIVVLLLFEIIAAPRRRKPHPTRSAVRAKEKAASPLTNGGESLETPTLA